MAVGESGGNAGVVRGVRFSHLSGDAENGIVLFGDPKGSIEDIAFDHVSFRFRVTRPQVNAAVGGNFDLRWTAAGPANGIVRHDAPGLYARYVDGLTIDGLDLAWSGAMPDYYSSALEIEDTRKNYGERRIICYGLLSGRLVVIGYTARGTTRHVLSMRKANHREKARLATYFEIRPRQS